MEKVSLLMKDSSEGDSQKVLGTNLSATLGIIKINFPLSYLATANLELFFI